MRVNGFSISVESDGLSHSLSKNRLGDEHVFYPDIAKHRFCGDLDV